MGGFRRFAVSNEYFWREAFGCEECESVLAVVLISVAGQRLSHTLPPFYKPAHFYPTPKKWRKKCDFRSFNASWLDRKLTLRLRSTSVDVFAKLFQSFKPSFLKTNFSAKLAQGSTTLDAFQHSAAWRSPNRLRSP